VYKRQDVWDVPVYKTVIGGTNRDELKSLLRDKEIHSVTFTSSSTVANFIGLIGEGNPAGLLEGVKVACIGPVTAETARQAGLTVHIEASRYTIEGLVEAILESV